MESKHSQGGETTAPEFDHEEAGAEIIREGGLIGEELSLTIQVKPYHPVSVRVWAQLPCSEEDMTATYGRLHAFLNEKMLQRKNEINAYRKSLGNGQEG